MKRFNQKLALVALCASAITANANEVIELQVGAFLNVCSESKDSLECETQGLPENPSDFVKQIELTQVEDAPGLSIGVYSESKFGLEYVLAIVKMEQEGAAPFYSIAASIGQERDSQKLRALMIGNTAVEIPGLTSLVVDDLRDIQFVMHSGASSPSPRGEFRQPGLIFGWEDLSENFATKGRIQNKLLR